MIQPFFEKCKKVVGNKIFSGVGDKERSMSDGTENAVIYLRNQIGRTNASDINELKKKLIENVDDFIIERIVYAQDLLIKNGDKIIHDKR
jgi:predicted DNA-binding protein